jgi:cytochrome c-type biogenesis protein CcmF
MGLLVLGVTGSTAWKSETVTAMRPGDATTFAGYTIALRDVQEVMGPDYQAERASVSIRRGDKGAPILVAPEIRLYLARQTATTEAAIQSGLLGNLYVSIGEQDDSGLWAVRLYQHPLVVWIWIGALTMAAGGFLSIQGGLLALLRRRLFLLQPIPAPAE